MYYVNAKTRMKKEIVAALNEHFGDKAVVTAIDGKLEISIMVKKGFDEEVKTVPEPLIGGGFKAALNGMKFKLTLNLDLD